MPVIPRGYISLEKLDEEIERAKQKLGPEVVRVRYNVGVNMWEDPAIYFRVVLTDSASREETLADVAEQIERLFSDELHLIENWGLKPYFSFRNQSEQAKREHLDLDWV
ncbi:MAG: hypothetical protein ACKV2U_29615 [Bryobacteraceae bacterium]